ncbi:MAG: hypothetical protein ACRD3L_10830 [Terriglobales bacterium]
MARKIYSDQELLDFSEEHVMYELNIFRWLVDAIPSTKKDFQLSAYLESFAIHLRGLIDFFFTLPKDAKNDDVIAADFFDPASPWIPGVLSASLKDARERTNKEVGHITYKRKTGMDPTKPWPVGSLFNEIVPVARKFADDASGKKLHPSVVRYLKSDGKQMLIGALLASTVSTNTSAVMIVGTSVSPLKKTP